jgi:hypothetical protein
LQTSDREPDRENVHQLVGLARDIQWPAETEPAEHDRGVDASGHREGITACLGVRPRRSHFPPLFSSLSAVLAWSATRFSIGIGDLVLLACKASDLGGAMASFAPAVGPNTAIQNRCTEGGRPLAFPWQRNLGAASPMTVASPGW